jgi:signal transduction histidine kinase
MVSRTPMGSNPANRRAAAYALLITLGLAVCGWQAVEHARFRENAKQGLVNRGNAITETLRVVVRSQQNPRFGGFVIKERLDSALNEFTRSNEIEAIAFLSPSGEPVAQSGKPITLTPEQITKARGVLWSDRSLVLINLTKWDSPVADDGVRAQQPPIIVDETLRNRPPATATRRFGQRPTQEEFDAMVQRNGVQSILVSLSTADMNSAVSSDLLMRLLVSALAMGGAVISAFAWRNFGKSAELQIRLIKAGEMNTHLKEMNLAAAGLAHETRNPLNLIRGRAQMIAMQAKDSPALAENASIILEEADRVTVQLNEFINYSKPREAQLAPVDVQRLVADVSRTLLPDIEEKQIELTQPAAPVSVEADEQLLRQALFNVLLNAVQAVPAGGKIWVKITPTSNRRALLEICDDGPGVPAADRASIFKPYVTMRPRGVGLGLAIVAQIAAVHHWEATCLANEPRGACFRFAGLKLAAPAT